MAASIRPVFFESAEAFRRWLEQNGHREQELVVGFHKVGTGKPGMSWSQSVDEALCFGWIDGVRKRIDDESYQIRFTPRRQGSIWSTVNIAKVDVLSEGGRMREPGIQAFAQRTADMSSIYSYEQAGLPKLTAGEVRTFKANKAAWRFYGAAAPGYRKLMVHRIVTAKQQATRSRRLAEFIDACAEGRKLR